MKVVCIRKGVKGLTKGLTYEVKGANYTNNTVTLLNNVRVDCNYGLDVDVIILREDRLNSLSISSDGPSEMYLSFLQAVEECGGGVPSILNRFEKELTSMCNLLGPNEVRFVCTKLNNVTPKDPVCDIMEHSKSEM